jgi:hypothetical protein
MSDYAADVRSKGEALKQKFIRLEVQWQMEQIYAENKDDLNWTHEEKLDAMKSWETHNYDEVASWFADLDDIFDELAQLPDPERISPKGDELKAAMTPLAGRPCDDLSEGTSYDQDSAYRHVGDTSTYLDEWKGDAAIAFKTQFAPAFQDVAVNEFRAVQSLKGALMAEAELWKKGREDVLTLINETDSALDDYEGSRDGAADAAFALAVIGAIVAVAAVPATGGTSAVLYWTMAGSAISVTGAVVSYPDEPKKELSIKGDSPHDICQSMREAVVDLKIQWINDEDLIRDQLQILTDTMMGYTQPGNTEPEDLEPRWRYSPGSTPSATNHVYNKETVWEFRLPRPALADSTPGNITDGNHMGQHDDFDG